MVLLLSFGGSYIVIARERSDEAIQTELYEPRLDCFVAALPRNDAVTTS
jgi:hypothetical protein